MRSITVFCGSNVGASPQYAEDAKALGREIARRGIRLVYGGSAKGLMGVIADSALAEGGEVIGIITRLLHDLGHLQPGLSAYETLPDMRSRKARMSELADGFIALPGGLGTFEEVLEAMTLTQLGEHQKGVACLNTANFFAPLRSVFAHAVREGFMKAEHRQMLIVEDNPGALLDALGQWQAPVVNKWIEPARH
ncbi:TIGR00730 family Rossman fold protein [Pseudomonas sp. S10E 269]|uniref:LOG family protein n=1 Tax=unclassified Pseudomonas TaxID=196821 RepID=UPI000C26338D|nr:MULTISPECIES: TIGR00730 family Rossman fold protein [unclassified Pseudomonas]PJK33388.1 TIGR00730 family Rossman fold protein [Pseudomonas sp. S09F 262]PJK42884.1 TIGR00730 family Rossman fold protein [Pseudomonas sp. S10E 269]